jgi:hypothetical protein
MAGTQDYFSDMLAPGEQVVAGLGAPGPIVERRVGQELVWYQLGVSQLRLLAVKLVQGPLGDGYKPVARWAVGREFVRIARFPRTPRSAARLEISGLPEPIVAMNIDEPAIFPHVEPFLLAWGGVVEGAGELAAHARDPLDDEPATDTRKLLVLVGAGLALMMACCGCAGLGAAVRTWVLPQL